ncbi:MAG: HAMP domain-containing histidine kinase [Butyrivibrio sp.]|nr:HAMP domain-containing histidine kinase [Butyrivibrio sp.]
MVNKLRKKFVITAMLSLLMILVLMIGIINAVNIYQAIKDSDNLLSILTTNNGYFPGMLDDKMQTPPSEGSQSSAPEGQAPGQPGDFQNPGRHFDYAHLNDMRSREMPFQTRYFWAKFDSLGSITETDISHIASVTEDEGVSAATEIYSQGKEKGFYHSFRYKLGKNDDGTSILVFTDFSTSLINIYRLLLQSLLIGLFTLIAMFILVYLFSGRAVAPAVESMEKQKRFITDAGHELKTPLAIISANIDVLELESGKSEWTSSIRNQVKRMNSLVKNLLTLSRMDEERMHVVYADFDMSAAVKETALSFEAVAESSSKKYTTDIEEGIHITGDKNAINQLTSLLLDNAMKYSDEKGSINVILSKDKNITLEVSNTTSYMPSGNLDRLFDRFYRADASRSREKGGYGIGLSVARAIAQSHGGDIQALKDGDRIIRFVVTLPLQLPKNLQKNSAK